MSVSETGPINDPAIKVISFDIFDTLVQRVTASPHDLFALLEPEVTKLTGGAFRNFQQVRPLAQQLAVARLGQPRQEATFQEIYEVLVELALLTPAQAEEVMAAEIEAEKRVLIPREEGLRYFRAARESGRRIILVSDMYLPAPVVAQLLEASGLTGYQALYVSSEYRELKHRGRLWDLIIEREGVAPAEILHIGDSVFGDEKEPAARGLKTIRLPGAMENFKAHRANKALYHKGFPDSAFPDASLFASLTAGLTAARFFADTANPTPADSQFGGDPFQLGYGAVGPAVSGFALWLAEKVREDGTEDLFFLARDGALLKRAFDFWAPRLCPEVRSHYLYNSRKTTLSAGIQGAADLLAAIMSYFLPVSLERFLNDKFGLKAGQVPPELLAAHRLRLTDEVGMKSRSALIPFCLELAPVIYQQAAATRAAVSAYLDEAGFKGAKSKAVVDIGHSAAIQMCLADLAGDPNLAGYYFTTDHRAARALQGGFRIRSFFEGLIDKFSPQFTHKYVYNYFETFFKPGEEGSLDEVTLGPDGRPRLTFRPLVSERNRHILNAVQDGATAFARALATHFGPWLEQIKVNPYTAALPYLLFFERPTARDARLLEGFMVDDTFCGTDRKYFIVPAGRGATPEDEIQESYWREGAEVLKHPASAWPEKLETGGLKDKLTEGRALYLWGAGRWGRVLLSRLTDQGLPVTAFLDSAAETMAPQVLGHRVLKPDQILAAGPDGPGRPIIIITPQFFREAMLPQAEAAGFKRGENLFVADDFTPRHYIVEVSGRCNLRCLACPRGRRGRRRAAGGLMSLDDFSRVIRKIKAEDPLAANLQLYQWGEPLLNPELPRMIALARELGLPVSISSNLNLDVDLEPIIAAGPDWFRVSLSGFGPDYERTHTGGSWPRVLANMQRLAEAKSLNPGMRIEVYYHLYAHNQGRQLEQARQLCRELGFEFQPVWAYLISLDEVLDHTLGLPLPPEAGAAAELLAVKMETALEAARRDRQSQCLVENVIMIDWDLSVPTCLMYYYEDDNRLADNYLETPLAEIERLRLRSPLCARCRSQAMHRYCDVYYNWPQPDFLGGAAETPPPCPG